MTLRKTLFAAMAVAALAIAGSSYASTTDPYIPWNVAAHATTIGSTTVNVHKFGALGNGVHDDTAAFQSALDSLPTDGGTVYVPAGKYMVDATVSIKMRSHTRLLMNSGAELVTIPNGQNRYYLIRVANVSDVRIVGGTLTGDREQHMGTTGEWGFGVDIVGSTRVVVKGTTIRNFWGDGIMIAHTRSNGVTNPSSYVTVMNVTSDNNRRQGLSIAGPADHVLITDSTFSNTNGTLPMAGIDLEPQLTGLVDTVAIIDNVMTGNTGNGIESHANVTGVTIKGNTLADNHGFGLYVGGVNRMWTTRNDVTRNGLAGVRVTGGSDTIVTAYNTIDYNSARYRSVTSIGGGLARDYQESTGVTNVVQRNNTFTPQQ